MKKLFLPFLLLLVGCATYRTKITIAETRDVLSQSEKYNVREFASDHYDIALNNINSAEVMLKRGRPKEGLASAEAALVKAREAFDTAIRSQAAILLKKARDARAIAMANSAPAFNKDSFDLLESYTSGAEQAFVAGKFEESINSSEQALYYADIIAGFSKEDVRLKIEQIKKKAATFSGSDDEMLKITSNIEEAERLYNAGHYTQALKILTLLDNQVIK